MSAYQILMEYQHQTEALSKKLRRVLTGIKKR